MEETQLRAVVSSMGHPMYCIVVLMIIIIVFCTSFSCFTILEEGYTGRHSFSFFCNMASRNRKSGPQEHFTSYGFTLCRLNVCLNTGRRGQTGVAAPGNVGEIVSGLWRWTL